MRSNKKNVIGLMLSLTRVFVVPSNENKSLGLLVISRMLLELHNRCVGMDNNVMNTAS
jgi:hypothetical protein